MAYILIVDDDLDFSLGIANLLRIQGHEVQVETDDEKAISRMEKHRPDLVILDVMFPENDSAGFALARTMHHHLDPLIDIPILLLTAVNSKLPLGFGPRDIDDHWVPVSDFLEKPVDISVLRQKVEVLLEHANT
jgi:CheY-like chemotaxis protein